MIHNAEQEKRLLAGYHTSYEGVIEYFKWFNSFPLKNMTTKCNTNINKLSNTMFKYKVKLIDRVWDVDTFIYESAVELRMNKTIDIKPKNNMTIEGIGRDGKPDGNTAILNAGGTFPGVVFGKIE